MATHSSILTWENPWTEEAGRLQSMGSQKSWTQLSTHTRTTCVISVPPSEIEPHVPCNGSVGSQPLDCQENPDCIQLATLGWEFCRVRVEGVRPLPDPPTLLPGRLNLMD